MQQHTRSTMGCLSRVLYPPGPVLTCEALSGLSEETLTDTRNMKKAHVFFLTARRAD